MYQREVPEGARQQGERASSPGGCEARRRLRPCPWPWPNAILPF